MRSGAFRAARALSNAGLSTEAAGAIARSITDLRTSTRFEIAELRSATKRDITELRAATKRDITELRAATKTDIAELRADLREEMAALRIDVKSDLLTLRSALEWRMYMMFGGTIVTIVGSIAALARTLH